MNRISQSFDSFAQIATLFLLGIVAFNILARSIFNISAGNINMMIPGAIELSQYTLLLIIFAALPRASSQGMVRVDLISNHLPSSLSHLLNKLWLLLMAIFSGSLVWLFFNKALLTFNRGDATQDLQMPLFYFYSLIGVACIATTSSCLLSIFSKKPFNIEEPQE